MRPVHTRLTTAQAVEKLGFKPIDQERKAVKDCRAAMQAGVSAWLTRQAPRVAEQVIEALGLEKARRKAGGDPESIAAAGQRARAVAVALEFDQIEKLVLVVEEQLAAMMLSGALAGLLQVGGSVADGLLAEATLPFAQARAAEMVGMKRNPLGQLVANPDAKWRIDQATRDMVQAKVNEALTEGWSADELKKGLLESKAFSRARAEMIARTELARADVAGAMTGYRASGLVAGKTWSTSADDMVSDACVACAAAGVIALDAPFPSGADAPPNHPNCRCSVLPVLNDEMPEKGQQENPMTKLYAAIEKAEKQDDGTIKVYGYASSAVVDSDGETITADAMKAARDGYMAFANVREMHDPKKAAGVAIEYDVQDDGKTWFGAHVVDPIAVKKVETGVYKGFSIGARVPAGGRDGKVIKAIELREVSLVDRPANPEAVFTMFKADGAADEAGADDVSKGVYTAKTLIDALGLVRSCCGEAEYEAKYGGHSAELVTEMKGMLAGIGAIAQKYLGEEIAAMLAPPADGNKASGGGELQKAGRRFSRATKAALKGAHEACKAADKALAELGYEAEDDDEEGDDDKAPPTDKAAAEAELQKRAAEQQAAQASQAAVEEIAKAAGLTLAEPTQDALTKAALTELLTLRKAHADLLASPAAPKGVRSAVVSKAADLDGKEDKEPAPIVKSDGAVDDVATLVKAAQARPIRLA